MRLPDVRGFVADLDGTIVPEGVMKADSRLLAAFGSLPSETPAHVATGRTYEFCRPIFKNLGLTQSAIVENGSRIIDPMTDHVYHEVSIDEGITADVLTICGELAPYERCQFAGDPKGTRTVVSERIPCANKGIFLLDLSRVKAEKITRHLQQIAVYAYISVAWSAQGELCDVNIHHPDATKGHALRILAEMHDYDLKTLLAVGNDVNDLSMFELVGATAAPADASPVILQKADIIFPPASELGFLEILDGFIRR